MPESNAKPYSPCREACPAGINIPKYVRFVREGKFDEALAVIRESMPFPAVCGYACVHPCETNCARKQYDQPVAIRMLKRAAVEKSNGLWKEKLQSAAATGAKVAVIGAGPCGLTAAYYLARKGHQAVVFEALPEAGGMMRYGIPEYRLPNAVLDGEIAEIKARGVEIRTGSRVQSLDALFNEGYQAVFVASGAWLTAKLGVEGTNSTIVDGIEFLQAVNSGKEVAVGEKVVVVGGGNTAIDAARASVRLGAKEVMVVYRRTKDEMPASAQEIADALEEGVKIEFLAAPVKVAGDKVICTKMKLGAKDASGRPAPVPVEGSEFNVECHTVITAIGQKADAAAFGLTGNANGTIVVDENSMATSREGVFAAGDVVTGPSSIIEAVAQGSKAAVSIDRFLGGDGEIAETLVEENDPELLPVVTEGFERAFTRTIPYKERLESFGAVEMGYSDAVAMREAQRCLGCDVREYKVEVDYSACKECGYCKEVCCLSIFKSAEGFNDRGYKPMKATDSEKCVGCMKCFFVCPDWAISIEKVGGVS